MAFKLQSINDIFPTPLALFEVEGAAKLNKTLMTEIAARRKVESGMTKSNRKGWHSERDLFDRKEPAHAELAQMLLRMMAQATKQVAPDTNFTNVELLADGWINVNQQGAYNSPHDHIGAFWSGVYYVRVPQDAGGHSGAIEFLSPHKPLPGKGIVKAPITSDKLVIHPEAGQVLIFPCTLVHWVHPNDDEQERVTIAFNGHFRRRSPTQVGAAIRAQKR